MSRTKKPSKLSANERAFLDRIRSLNEEETEKLTVEEIIAYLNIMDKIDPRLVRHAFEEVFIDRGCTNSEVLRLLERAKEREMEAMAGRPVACRAATHFAKQSADGVATKQEDHRSPRSGRAARHRRWGRARG
jgi:hypothetical protein